MLRLTLDYLSQTNYILNRKQELGTVHKNLLTNLTSEDCFPWNDIFLMATTSLV